MRKRKNLTIYILVIIIIALLLNLPFAKPIQSLILRIFNPIFSIFYKAGTIAKVEFGERSEKEDLVNKISKLEELNIQLAKENADLKTAKDENVFLRDHLNFLQTNKLEYVLADVVSKDDITNSSKKSELIVINKGRREGVVIGLPVVSSEGVIIGKIAEVKDDLSSVHLTNSSNCKLAATIFGQQKTSGITEGELGLTMKMDFIPQGTKVSTNDIVVTSGLEKNVPRGLLVGRVLSVNIDTNELWQRAVIEPIVNSEDLVIVSILMP